ncbi:MAG: branched-chain amino acid aminotransferase [Oscillospiraceae bacterium]
MEAIKITKTTAPKAKTPSDKLGFGKVFSDHMFLMDYDEGQGWHDPRIVPYGPIELMPCANVLHYAQEIFEGLKAYRTASGKVQLFRPTENIARMNNSAARLCIPHIPEDTFLEALKQLVTVDADWVPDEFGTSLYLRPFAFARDAVLGVHAGHHYLFCIICSPSGSYYAEGINPTKIMIESRDVRAVRGGTGFAKCGGNYAASLRAGEVAEAKGFAQVLWLDGVNMKYIEEVGAMNVMFKIDGKIITPDISGGSVLPGITRKSCLQVLKEWGYAVEERDLSVDELIEAAENGKLEEAWGCGTAAVVSPIGLLAYRDKEHIIAGNKIGALTQRLYDELTGIQWGKLPDTRDWIVPVC